MIADTFRLFRALSVPRKWFAGQTVFRHQGRWSPEWGWQSYTQTSSRFGWQIDHIWNSFRTRLYHLLDSKLFGFCHRWTGFGWFRFLKDQPKSFEFFFKDWSKSINRSKSFKIMIFLILINHDHKNQNHPNPASESGNAKLTTIPSITFSSKL